MLTIDRLDLSVRCDIAFWAAIVNVSVWGSSSHEARAIGVFSWAAIAAAAWFLRKFFERRKVVRDPSPLRQRFAAWRERTGFFMDGRDGGM